MPCWDISDAEYSRHEAKERAKFEAALCAIMTQLENNASSSDSLERFYNDIDWKEAGVTKKWLMNWWARHKSIDADRRVREAEERAKKERMKHLREKLNLTEEELKLPREML